MDKEGKDHTIPVDTLVFATGAISNDRLFNSLKGVVPNLYHAGDCVQPQGIMEAIEEGMQIAIGLN